MKQDLVFSVKLHLSLIPYPLSLIPYPLTFNLYPCCLTPSAVPFKKFRWGLLWFSLWFSLLLQVKVKSTPNPRSKTGVWQKELRNKTRLGLQCQTPLRSYPLSLYPYPLSLPLSPSTVPFKKFRWGFFFFFSLFLLLLLLFWLTKSKVNS